MALGVCSRAQSVANTTWKAYFFVMGDSVTLRFSADSMTAQSDSGHVLLQSGFKDSANFITVDDYSGLCSCPDFPGKYETRMRGDTLIIIPFNDVCDIRNSTLMAKKWVRVAAPPAAAPAAKKKVRKRG